MSGAERGRARIVLATTAAIALAMALPVALAAADAPAQVTPPEGASLVARIKTGVDWTSMGRMGASGGAPEAAAQAGWLEKGFDLTGEDLFRISCRSCHGPGAKTLEKSLAGILGIGGATPPAGSQTPGGELGVRHRLMKGGMIMPAFAHLRGDEVDAVIGYLRAVATGKPAPRSPTVHRSPAHVGELVVKAACQICHDATPGVERPAGEAMVVPLSQMTAKDSAATFVHKVREGFAPSPGLSAPQRMPHFDYLSVAELEAAYAYLTAYPPAPAH